MEPTQHARLFRPFGPDHWAVLIFTVTAALLVTVFSRRIRGLKDDLGFRRGYAVLLLVLGLSSWIYWTAKYQVLDLPLHLCDLALFLMVAGLVGQIRVARELAFFWGVSGSSQAILTPDLTHGFPSFEWSVFFASHAAVVLGALYLAARGLVRVTLGSVVRVFGWTNLYVVVVGLVNWQLGTNYGYLAWKPDQPSLLDYLGPWPIYIFWCELIALGLFFISYGVGRLIEHLSEKSS